MAARPARRARSTRRRAVRSARAGGWRCAASSRESLPQRRPAIRPGARSDRVRPPRPPRSATPRATRNGESTPVGLTIPQRCTKWYILPPRTVKSPDGSNGNGYDRFVAAGQRRPPGALERSRIARGNGKHVDCRPSIRDVCGLSSAFRRRALRTFSDTSRISRRLRRRESGSLCQSGSPSLVGKRPAKADGLRRRCDDVSRVAAVVCQARRDGLPPEQTGQERLRSGAVASLCGRHVTQDIFDVPAATDPGRLPALLALHSLAHGRRPSSSNIQAC
jgi:hypothetical protein